MIKSSTVIKLFIYYLFFVWPLCSEAKDQTAWANQQLANSIQIYEDKSGQKSIDDIRLLPEFEFKKGSVYQNFGFTTSAWWVKFQLTNPLDTLQKLLLNLANGHIHDIQFYSISPDDSSHYSTGNHFPFSSRPIKYTEYLFPIELKAGAGAQYYLRLEKKGAELNAPLIILPGNYNYGENFNRWNLLFGSTFLYILILFITFCVIRTRVILYYFLYATCLCLYMASAKGITFSAIWPDQTWIQTNILEMSKHLANIFYILFVLKFIGSNKKYPAINYFLQACIILCGLNIICRLTYASSNWISDILMMRFVQFTALLLPVADAALIFLLFDAWKTNKKAEVMWLMVLTTGLIIPLLFLVSLHFGWIPAQPFYPNMLVILFLLEIVCISIIIIYRYYELYTKEIYHLREITLLRRKAVENILLGQEEERIRIAKDLHDGISLSLASARMRLSSLEYKLEEGTQKKVLEDVVTQLGQTSQEVRNISHNLAPLSLQHQELTNAIQELVYQIELNDSNMDIEFNFTPEINKYLSLILKQNIYQTVKEIFNNILKYASASQIIVTLDQHQNQLKLEVADNGNTYDYAKSILDSKGVGLSSIQSRATLLHGNFEAKPRAGGGMLHVLSIPNSV